MRTVLSGILALSSLLAFNAAQASDAYNEIIQNGDGTVTIRNPAVEVDGMMLAVAYVFLPGDGAIETQVSDAEGICLLHGFGAEVTTSNYEQDLNQSSISFVTINQNGAVTFQGEAKASSDDIIFIYSEVQCEAHAGRPLSSR